MNRKVMQKYKDDILKDIAALVSIPSVAGPPAPNAPYGEPCAQALNFILERAKKLQFDTRNIDNAVGHAQYGSGVDIAAVITHVDVVSAGEGWSTDPFSATMIGRRLYGRGVADDKGAAVAALYCLKAIKDMGIRGKRRLRVIFGSAEETGMKDMELYFNNQPLPVLGFSPDSEYGICNREKGILHLQIKNPNPTGSAEFHAGRALNTVADRAHFSFSCSEDEYHALLATATKCAVEVTAEKQPERILLYARGRSEHAMDAPKGLNAATHLLSAVSQSIDISRFDPLILFLHEAIGTQTNGENLTIQCADEPSGELTINVGLVSINSETSSISLDIRYPVTSSSEEIIEKISIATSRYGLECELLEDLPPLYLPETSEISTILKRSYENITGQTANFYSTGGGTYARTLRGKGVAFGPLFHSGSYHNLHGANEFIDIDEFMMHCEICLEAMIQMMG